MRRSMEGAKRACPTVTTWKHAHNTQQSAES